MDASTAARLTANEHRFRAVNERLEGDVRAVTAEDERIGFVCECSLTSCRQSVSLTPVEYRELRSSEDRFAVVPGHELLEIERIVGRAAGYVVVEKLAD